MALVVIPAEGVVLCSRHDLNISPIQNLRFIWVSALRFHGDSVFIWKINKSSQMSALAGDFDKKDYVKLVRLNFWVESISPEKSLQRSIYIYVRLY